MTRLATVEELSAWRGAAIAADDLAADLALESASEVVELYCNRTFGLVTEERFIDGSGTADLLLPSPPVVEVTEVAILSEVGVETICDPTTYRLKHDVGKLHRLRSWSGAWTWMRWGWPIGTQNIRVAYSHGFEVVPPAARLACLQIAGRLVAGGSAGVSGDVSAQQIGAYRVEYEAGVSGSGSGARSAMFSAELSPLEPLRLPGVA